jgi:hypothetical protein
MRFRSLLLAGIASVLSCRCTVSAQTIIIDNFTSTVTAAPNWLGQSTSLLVALVVQSVTTATGLSMRATVINATSVVDQTQASASRVPTLRLVRTAISVD